MRVVRGMKVAVWGGSLHPQRALGMKPFLRSSPGRLLLGFAILALLMTSARSSSAARQLTLKGHTRFVTDLAFTPDGKLLVSGSDDGTVRLWDVRTGRLRRTLRIPGTISVSPDGRTIASGGYRTVGLWDVRSGRLRREWKVPASVYSVAFSPDGRLLASGGADLLDSRTAGTVRVWDAETGKLLRTLWWGAQVETLAFSPDGSLLAAGSGTIDATGLRLWDVHTGRPTRILDAPGCGPCVIYLVLFSPDGRWIAGASGTRDFIGFTIWDVRTGEVYADFPFSAGDFGVDGAAFTPDGKTLITAIGRDDDGEKIVFWDLRTKRVRPFLRTPGLVTSLALSRDGRWLAIGASLAEGYVITLRRLGRR